VIDKVITTEIIKTLLKESQKSSSLKMEERVPPNYIPKGMA
jgi:hypothetical protein